jgi:hypothetical protein
MTTNEFNSKTIDLTLSNYNKFYKTLKTFNQDDNFDMLFIPKVSDYIKTLKMKYDKEEDIKKIVEYEKDNDDYLQSLTKKQRKLINKQKQMKLLKNKI